MVSHWIAQEHGGSSCAISVWTSTWKENKQIFIKKSKFTGENHELFCLSNKFNFCLKFTEPYKKCSHVSDFQWKEEIKFPKQVAQLIVPKYINVKSTYANKGVTFNFTNIRVYQSNILKCLLIFINGAKSAINLPNTTPSASRWFPPPQASIFTKKTLFLLIGKQCFSIYPL